MGQNDHEFCRAQNFLALGAILASWANFYAEFERFTIAKMKACFFELRRTYIGLEHAPKWRNGLSIQKQTPKTSIFAMCVQVTRYAYVNIGQEIISCPTCAFFSGMKSFGSTKKRPTKRPNKTRFSRVIHARSPGQVLFAFAKKPLTTATCTLIFHRGRLLDIFVVFWAYWRLISPKTMTHKGPNFGCPLWECFGNFECWFGQVLNVLPQKVIWFG